MRDFPKPRISRGQIMATYKKMIQQYAKAAGKLRE